MSRKFSIGFIIFIFLTLAVQSARAQAGKFFDLDHLRSGVFINQLYIDREGYLWMVTSNGIVQYDGYQLQTFKKGQKNSLGLGNNHVLCMSQTHAGLFYFGFYGHLQVYDGVQFRNVTKYNQQGEIIYCNVNCILERKNGDLVAGTSTNGLLLVKDEYNAYQLDIDLQGAGEIRKMAEDNSGRLWIAAENGIFCYDGENIIQYMSDADGTKYYSICTDMADNIYVGTANRGLFRKQGELFVHVEATGNTPISALCMNHTGNILVGFDGKGIAVYNSLTGELEANPYYSHEVELPKSKVYAIEEDKNNNIWLGLSEKGVFQQPPSSLGFRYMGHKAGSANLIGSSNICCVFVDSKDNMWLGADKDGIYCLDKNGLLVNHYANNLPSTVLTICEDEEGRIWIGSYGEGGGWIDPQSAKYHPSRIQQNDFLSITDYAIDANGRVWAGTMGQGLLMFTKAGKEVKQYYSADSNEKGLSHNFIPQISLSADNNRLYVATYNGVNCLDLNSLTWNDIFGGNCLMPGANVLLAREYNDELWIGTTEGLFQYDLRKRELKHYTMEHGLPSNNVTTIEKDPIGQLWIGTDMGLSCLNPKNSRFQNYYADDGLQSNYFTTGASWAMSDGRILFGGTGGITWFNPTDIAPREWNAKIKLTAFTINGIPVDRTTLSGNYQVTDTSIPQNQYFELDYHDNSFAISFSTMTFDDPERIVYLYSINKEPFVTLQQGTNEITFSHLAPGSYRFRVKAAYKDCETPEHAFTVVVHAPWYRSWWAYLIYVIILILALGSYWSYRRRREHERIQLQEHIHAEELSEAKLRFFMNMSHDIRTPMTLIVTPLLSLIKHENDPHRKGIYEIMHRNAERILGLINQMMDLRKIDKGLMQMHMKKTDLVGFIQELYTLFEHQARSRQIHFLYEHTEETLPVWIDRRYFDKVIVNVLSNAFKFTPTGGEIVIVLSHDNQNATIAIRDNGESIPEDKLEHIFERFYQSDNKKGGQQTGTGIGLDLARSFIELHYGTISAHNLDKGCEFVISLPLGCEHLKADEMETESDTETTEQLTMAEMEDDNDTDEIIIKSPSNQRPLLFIAEDDTEIREYLVQEFGNNYRVKAFIDGQQAFNEAVHSVPDIVISDVMMPEMDGKTLCIKLRTNPITNHVPVILLTAKNLDEDRLKGLATGADAYIVKPFNMNILRQTIANLVQKTRIMRLKYEHSNQIVGQIDPKSVKSPDEKLLASIMLAINNHLNDNNLTIDLIANEVGLSRVHLYRKMKDLTGQTPHDFIRKVRLKKAAELLADGKMNVSEITYTCGFSSPTSFSALFKKFYGVAPSQYNKSKSQIHI